ncbi:ASCH domain-containing protein [Oerskovia turbata]|uniref:ASCH domain-containing protein n=1 Tax=Oerskovia turbata TaxID=1713 RepID=A0A4Q1L1L0_9CELL|nr:ASCH domain-containing protein [Oerskovia turbata]RXR26384.1 ASCH domain-containing protein [Oerskovia turbata]RXR36559.1 ASCH domain-containing protein [Oerskovia turbata]TGJ97577.1 ASCH domain-containing protein [Actinotalea fermentans ATCC 43279 = JCM 9966 = DSM 3133]
MSHHDDHGPDSTSEGAEPAPRPATGDEHPAVSDVPAGTESEQGEDDPRGEEILEFWETARVRAGEGKVGVVTGFGVSATVPPPAWSFGDNPALADGLLTAVLSGDKTATSSSRWEYGDDVPLPQVGELSIILDGDGHPRALIRTTSVEVVPFDQVTADFAAAEGEDDRTLESWRAGHRRYFTRVLVGHEFREDMPVVCERFELRFPRQR